MVEVTQVDRSFLCYLMAANRKEAEKIKAGLNMAAECEMVAKFREAAFRAGELAMRERAAKVADERGNDDDADEEFASDALFCVANVIGTLPLTGDTDVTP